MATIFTETEATAFLPIESNTHLTFTDRSFTKHPDYDAVVEALGPIARDLGYDGVDAGYRGGGVLHALWLLESGPAVTSNSPRPNPVVAAFGISPPPPVSTASLVCR